MLFEWEVSLIIGGIAAFILTVIIYATVMSRKKDGNFKSGFAQALHNFFNFKTLLIESVLKFIYVAATIASVTIGFFMLFGYEYHFSYSYYYGYYDSYSHKESTALVGLILMVAGPIAIRLVFEGIMMIILLVKNVIEINNKLRGNVTIPNNVPQQPIPDFRQNVQPPVYNNQNAPYAPPVQPNSFNRSAAAPNPSQVNISEPVAVRSNYSEQDLEKTQAVPYGTFTQKSADENAVKSPVFNEPTDQFPFDCT